MSTEVAIREPGNSANLQLHHDHWSGSANAKTATATAANTYDHQLLWSLTAAMLHEQAISTHTLRAYRRGFHAYTSWAEEVGVNLVRPQHGTGLRYRTHLVDERGGKDRANPGTINVMIAGAKLVARSFAWIDLRHTDAFKGVKALRDKREPSTVRAEYKPLDIARLLEACDDPYDRAMVLLGASAGLRAAEMIALEWDAHEREDGNGTRVTLPERNRDGTWTDAGELLVLGKGGTLRPVEVGDELLDALADLPTRTGPVLAHVRSTSGLRYRIARLAERVGLITKARPKKGTPKRSSTMGLHRLRHAFGCSVVGSLGLAQGRVALRHASVATTQRYFTADRAQLASFARGLRRGL